MKLKTRDYQPEDFKEVAALWEATGMGGEFRGDDRQVIDRSIQVGGKLLILEDEHTHKLIGTSWMTMDGRRIYLHHFGISPAFQGKGFSKQLLKASLAFAKKTGLQLKLEVHRDNIIARELYIKAGFKYLGDYDVYIIRNYENL
ncbi:MAG: GNAT family N-acetyltransferase [Bacteroidetes bacterium]|nr:GNAT family N-acetyltransferase [Bacteroidota bacterium]